MQIDGEKLTPPVVVTSQTSGVNRPRYQPDKHPANVESAAQKNAHFNKVRVIEPAKIGEHYGEILLVKDFIVSHQNGHERLVETHIPKALKHYLDVDGHEQPHESNGSMFDEIV